MKKITRPSPKQKRAAEPRRPSGPPQIPVIPPGPIPPEWKQYMKRPEPVNPYKKAFLAWADKNSTLMSQYPNSYLAVDIRNNYVAVAEKDQSVFAQKYLALPPEDHTILYSFHTSLYGF